MLSASEVANHALVGCSVADSVVAAYGAGEAARDQDISLRACVFDVRDVEVERVAQLSGALIDAGCSEFEFHDVDDRAALLRALAAANIDVSQCVLV